MRCLTLENSRAFCRKVLGESISKARLSIEFWVRSTICFVLSETNALMTVELIRLLVLGANELYVVTVYIFHKIIWKAAVSNNREYLGIVYIVGRHVNLAPKFMCSNSQFPDSFGSVTNSGFHSLVLCVCVSVWSHCHWASPSFRLQSLLHWLLIIGRKN